MTVDQSFRSPLARLRPAPGLRGRPRSPETRASLAILGYSAIATIFLGVQSWASRGSTRASSKTAFAIMRPDYHLMLPLCRDWQPYPRGSIVGVLHCCSQIGERCRGLGVTDGQREEDAVPIQGKTIFHS